MRIKMTKRFYVLFERKIKGIFKKKVITELISYQWTLRKIVNNLNGETWNEKTQNYNFKNEFKHFEKIKNQKLLKKIWNLKLYL